VHTEQAECVVHKNPLSIISIAHFQDHLNIALASESRSFFGVSCASLAPLLEIKGLHQPVAKHPHPWF
jgi:hypothetical protein